MVDPNNCQLLFAVLEELWKVVGEPCVCTGSDYNSFNILRKEHTDERARSNANSHLDRLKIKFYVLKR